MRVLRYFGMMLGAAALFILNVSFTEIEEEVEIEWITFEEAIKRSNQPGNTKKVFVDVYTDWCGWCKVMDKKTFKHPEVAKYMTENFHMVKLDAEQKEDISYRGHTFKFIQAGRNGYHELAAALLQGELSFPSVLFMDEKMDLITVVPGYQPPTDFYPVAKYFGDDHYKTKKWEQFNKEYKLPF